MAESRNKGAFLCEECEYYDFADDGSGEMVCYADVDEDEMLAAMSPSRGGCPHYKFYDEYKTVRRQN